MRIQFKNVPQNKIVFFDIEYDRTNLVQLACLIFTQTEEQDIYELNTSFNMYIKGVQPVTHFFSGYTGITNDFLDEYGLNIEDAKDVLDSTLSNLLDEETLVVSHGVANDIYILNENDIRIYNKCKPYCTYTKAKQLLKRDCQLRLSDIAAEGQYCIFNEHNAYADVWGTLYAFAYLNELENKKETEC